MDERHKQLLKKHHRQLLDINTRDVVVDYLFQEQIISSDEKDVICQKPTPVERSRALLDILPRKGVEAFGALLVALRREGVTKRHRELADLLDPPAPATSGSSSKKATSTSISEPVKPTTAKPTTAKPTTAKPTADAKKPAAGSHPHLLEPPAPAGSGSSSKKATSTSGSEPVNPATAKPTAGAKKPVQAAKSHPSKPVSSGDSVSRRDSTYSVKNSDLGTCPKCSDGNLRLRKDVGGHRCKIGCSNFPECNAFITFSEFVTDVSPAGRNCKCGKRKVELKFIRGKAPEGMKQGYKGCINGDCDQLMQRNRWTITKSSSSKKATSTSGSKLVKPAAAKPTVDARKPVQVAESHPSKPVSSGSSVVQRRSMDSEKNWNPDLGTCPKCSEGNLRLRKEDGETCYKIGCLAYRTCNAFIVFPEFVTDVSPAQRKCKCGKKKVELKFMRGKAPEGMKQGYKGCINGGCDQLMQRNRWTITKSSSSKKATSTSGSKLVKPAAAKPTVDAKKGNLRLRKEDGDGMIDVPNLSWQCDCGRPAERFQTKKEGPNHGRWFHKCDKRDSDCRFWGWEDELLHGSRMPSSSQQLRAASTSASQSLSSGSGSGSVNASGPGLKRSREEMNGGGGDGDSTPKRKPPT